MAENVPAGTLKVDFDEVTRMFAELRSVAAEASSPHEFARIVQVVTEKLFLKYFEFPESRMYRVDDLHQLVQHVMDCINNITPVHISYRSVFEDGKWKLYPKKSSDKTTKPS